MLDPFPILDDQTTIIGLGHSIHSIATAFTTRFPEPLPVSAQALLTEIGLPIHVIRGLLPSETGTAA